MKVKPSKQWPVSDFSDEQLDYADFDAAGMPIFQMENGDITSVQLNAASMLSKVDALGGPANRGTFVLPADFTVQTGFTMRFGQLNIPGSAGGLFKVDNLDLNLLVTAWADASSNVNLQAYNRSGANIVIPQGAVFNFVFFVP